MSRWWSTSIMGAFKLNGGRASANFPRRPGVYVVYAIDNGDRTLIYVGSSDNLRVRWDDYVRPLKLWRQFADPVKHKSIFFKTSRRQGYFDDIVVKMRFSRRPGEHLMAEYRLINRVKPPWNRSNKRNGHG